MLKKLHISVAGVAVTMLAVVGLVTPVYAHEGEDHRVSVETSAREHIQGRLNEAKKQVCATRSQAVVQVMSAASLAGQRHLAKFNAIVVRIEEFYAKNTPAVANYDAFLNTVEIKRDAAAAAVDAVKTNVAFDCDSDNPVGAADEFGGKVRSMYSALKEYRSAISNLLVAVRNAAKGGQ